MRHRVAMLLSNPFLPDPRVYKEAKALACDGYEVTVFAWDRECRCREHDVLDGIPIERIPVKATYGRGLYQASGLLLFYRKVLPRLRRGRFDVIHCHDLDTLPLGLWAGRLTHAKVVFDAHEVAYYSDTRGLPCLTAHVGKVLERLLAGQADLVLVVNDYQIAKYNRMNVKGLRLVPNYPESTLVSSKPLTVNNGSVVVGRIGAIHKGAGVEHLIDAFSTLRDHYPGMRLKIAGGTACSDTRVIWRKLASLGESAEVISEYRYSDLERLYADLDIWVMPTDPVSFAGYLTPTKFFEALCFGKPVIVSNTGRMGEIVQQEKCGLVLDRLTSEDIADAIRRLTEDAGLRKAMGENGQRAIRTRYNWDVSVRELLSAYCDLL